jgi:hypothetical protein
MELGVTITRNSEPQQAFSSHHSLPNSNPKNNHQPANGVLISPIANEANDE